MIRICIVLLLACSISVGQESRCSSLKLRVVDNAHKGTTPAWRVFLKNATTKDLRVHVPPQQFHWTIEKYEKQKWDLAFTGGIGPGMPSNGAMTTQSSDTLTIRRGHSQLVADFDLRRDISEEENLEKRSSYRITFLQEIQVADSDGALRPCRLTAPPQMFRSDAVDK